MSSGAKMKYCMPQINSIAHVVRVQCLKLVVCGRN